MTLAIIAVGVIVILAASVGVHLAAGRRRDRRDWPHRLRQDYETERVRDHFFQNLTVEDVEWLASQGWHPPAEAVARRERELHFRSLRYMNSKERDSVAKMRALGSHISAHADDLHFEV